MEGSHASWAGDSFYPERPLNISHGDGLVGLDRTSARTTFSSSDSSGASSSRSNKTVFNSNDAKNGGALFVAKGVTLEWDREIDFVSNNAVLDGGSVGSNALSWEWSYSTYGPDKWVYGQRSVIAIISATRFVNDTCGSDGGGLAMVQSLTVLFESTNILFWENSAGVSGGTVFLTGTGIGTMFNNVAFVGKSAPTGGGVRVTESGTALTINSNNEQVENPVTFECCRFIGHIASATGGAVDSASGQDVFILSLFEGNHVR